jgi:heme oxygenase
MRRKSRSFSSALADVRWPRLLHAEQFAKMQQTSWMLEQLAHETRVHYSAADGDRLAAMERPSEQSYRSFLIRVYCFEAPLEAAFASTAGFNQALLRTHMKTKRLAADLDALGVSADKLETGATQGFADIGNALGWMYVLQRNTLLHGLLFRHLQSRIPSVVKMAGSYLTTHENVAGARLRELGMVLDNTARRTSIAARIVHAAGEAFRCQRQWYACERAQPQRSRPVTQSQLSGRAA